MYRLTRAWIFAGLLFFPQTCHSRALGQQVFSSFDLEVDSVVNSPDYSKSIAIVGAGSAGLAALSAILDLPEDIRKDWDVVLFEERRNVSGVWLPDPTDPHPPILPKTPLYPSLRTNTPHPTMTYPHFPFPPGTPLYPSHEHVEQYHVDYARHFGLLEHIRFNTSVISAQWVGNSTRGRWNVTTLDKRTQARSYKLFDHLISANGHYRYPCVPTWAGQDAWVDAEGGREILHSIYWRNGTKYAGKNVLVIGGGASGRDVILHTAPHAEKVYLSLRSGTPPNRLDVPYIIKPGISHFTPKNIVFTDGSYVSDVDAVILATGYELRVPFLSAGEALTISPGANSSSSLKSVAPSQLTTNLRYIYPLHEHIFSLAASYPSNALAFVGLPVLVANCPSDYAQALLVAHALADDALLPSRAAMLRSLDEREAHYRERGFDPYDVGHRLVDVDGTGNASFVYQEGLIEFLKQRGARRDDGQPYVEAWRRLARNENEMLWRAWMKVEGSGPRAVEEWLDGVKTEDEWAGMMRRLIEWERGEK